MAPSQQLAPMPDALRTSIEKLLLDTTETLDPLVSLKITNLTLNLVAVVYQMGQQDARSPHSFDF